MINRRNFIRTLTSTGALMSLPALSSCAISKQERKFLFVFIEGGWDPLCVFAPLFDASDIDMEPDAQPMSIGKFRLVDHAQRPSVRSFFQKWGSSTLVIDGISTRSISHEVCAEIALTGNTSGSAADWPTLIALDQQERFAMPSLVFSGMDRAFAPTFPGDHEVVVVRTGESNQLESMLEGYYIEETDLSVLPIPNDGRAILDRYVRERSQTLSSQFAQRGGRKLLCDFRQSLDQVQQLKSLEQQINFASEEGGSQLESALSALSMGLCRCATLADGRDWDTHEDNSPQNPQFEDLFAELSRTLSKMSTTPGTHGGSLLDETVVVVMSEMGRTPKYNATGGRDHWPYTSAMVIGKGIKGGRSIGSYNNSFSGIGFDHRNGKLQDDIIGVSSEDFGATLLAMAGIDSGIFLPNARPFDRLVL